MIPHRYTATDCDPCYQVNNKRLINMGTRIEQRPWTPTVRRGKIGAETASPGPACVVLPPLVGPKVHDSKKQGAPAFSFGSKHRRTFDTVGPGPAEYDISGLNAKGKNTPPTATLQGRRHELTKHPTPAPGEYDVERAAKKVIDAAPKYTFGGKTGTTKISITPGPNVYKIPPVLGGCKDGPLRSAPAYSIAGRTKGRTIQAHVLPGPGYYDGEYKVLKRKPPVYTMSIKHKVISDDHMKPGPGAHCPEKFVYHRATPAPSFAILHSKHLGQRKPYMIEDAYYGRNVSSKLCTLPVLDMH